VKLKDGIMVYVSFVQAGAGVFLAEARDIHAVSTNPKFQGHP
jgi:hypothetical protein